jgi:hypothetical protein
MIIILSYLPSEHVGKYQDVYLPSSPLHRQRGGSQVRMMSYLAQTGDVIVRNQSTPDIRRADHWCIGCVLADIPYDM